MQMSRAYKISTIIGLVLATFCVACRYFVLIADWYAHNVYPIISDILSWVSAPIPFNIEELTIIGIVLLAVAMIVASVKNKWGWKRCLRYELTILLWTYVWFYMAWCNNYGRSSIFERTSTVAAMYDKTEFVDFCNAFIQETNNSWTDKTFNNQDKLETEVKTLYANAPEQYGLSAPRSWHHPKPIMFNSLYSSVGILGFMAPLYGESLLNTELMDFDYPFTCAHEYAHMLGISSEAEANWWAFVVCTSSENKAVRYSAYKGILPYVLYNARLALNEKEYTELTSTIDKRVVEDIEETREHWRSKRSPLLRAVHEWTYDRFLKSNSISTGIENYSEVVRMLISLKKPSLQNIRKLNS